MITLGIDLSSMPEGTAACSVTWADSQAIASPPAVGCGDDKLDALISEADVIGIDAPFGWPEDFVAAVANWTADAWSPGVRDRMRFRMTDFVVSKRVGRPVLSVSTNQIALPAVRAMALLRRHGVTDRSGDGRFFEVYPAGSLFCWNLRCRGYKGINAECTDFRRDILGKLRGKLPCLDVSETYADSSDTLDALIASLTVRAAAQGATIKPSSNQITFARREGWIHLPSGLPWLGVVDE